MKLRVVPLTLADANRMVAMLHRHHKPAQGHRFSIGAVDAGGRLVGAAIVGRPVSRRLDHTHIAEVLRLVTDGTPNACSFLYGASARVAKAMGFSKIQTYILREESGVSLRAAGWESEGETGGSFWHVGRQGRTRSQPSGVKQRWSRTLTMPPPAWTAM